MAELMSSLQSEHDIQTWGTSGTTNIERLISLARSSVSEENVYNNDKNTFDRDFSSFVKTSIEKNELQYDLLRAMRPKR